MASIWNEITSRRLRGIVKLKSPSRMSAYLCAALALLLLQTAPLDAQPMRSIDYDVDDDGMIEISYLEQLNAVRYDLDGDGLPDRENFRGAYNRAFPDGVSSMGCPFGRCEGYELARDLDFEAPLSYASAAIERRWIRDGGGPGWEPLWGGTQSDIKWFQTTLDGNNHVISNLFVDRPTESGVGLFRILHQLGKIRRIRLTEVEISGFDTIGGLVATNTGEIDSSHAHGKINGDSSLGGLVGSNSGAIRSSSGSGELKGTSSVGGLVGRNLGDIVGSYASSNVNGHSQVGGLSGMNTGTIAASFAVGTVGSLQSGGGLVGVNRGRINAAYATGSVKPNAVSAGGLVGTNYGTVAASFSTAEVVQSPAAGGLIGLNVVPDSIFNSYWCNEIANRPIGVGVGFAAGAEGKTVAELQSPTAYDGIFASWNVNLGHKDDDPRTSAGKDDPWDFGASDEFPALKVDFDGDGIKSWQEFGPQPRKSPTPRHSPSQLMPAPYGDVDYDVDDDGLVEVTNLEQLDAVRYDLDGNGEIDNASFQSEFALAFPNAAPSMGCPISACRGYEMVRDLDFEDADSYASGSVNESWVDIDGREGWTPIGRLGHRHSIPYYGLLDGNGKLIANLFIDRTASSGNNSALFGSLGDSGAVVRIGIVSANIHGSAFVGGLVGTNSGKVANSFTEGKITGKAWVGGIAGINRGSVVASFSKTDVEGRTSGGIVGTNNDGRILASYATGSVAGAESVGGLVGWHYSGSSIKSSYSVGPVTGFPRVGGLVGFNAFSGTPFGVEFESSYWDIDTSGQSLGVGEGDATGVNGGTTEELQSPTDYFGIYSDWNVDIDNADGDDDRFTGIDDPWDFGSTDEYPVLKIDFNGDGLATWQEFGVQRILKSQPSETIPIVPPATGGITFHIETLLAFFMFGLLLVLGGVLTGRGSHARCGDNQAPTIA